MYHLLGAAANPLIQKSWEGDALTKCQFMNFNNFVDFFCADKSSDNLSSFKIESIGKILWSKYAISNMC